MPTIRIESFVPAQELFALFDELDLETEPAVELTDTALRVTFANGVTLALGITQGEEALTIDSLEVTGPAGEPLVSIPEIGLILTGEGVANLDDFTGFELVLTDADDSVDADAALAGFDAVLPLLPAGDDADQSLLSGGLIDFGGGRDTLVFDLPRAALTERLGEDGRIAVVSELGTASFAGLEEIRLADGTYLYGLSDDAPFVYRLYSASLARTPDAAGLAFWDDAFTSGTLSRKQLAGAFAGSPEFVTNFLADPSDEAFVEALYQNVLGRTAEGDPGGAFWLDAFQNRGFTRADMLLAFADSPENLERNADNYDDGVWVA